MKISGHQFLLLGQELDKLSRRVTQRILDLNFLLFFGKKQDDRQGTSH
jgi:hypothetical protein